MEIKRLEHFLMVAEHGSFSRASTVIGIAQPALGRQIQKLEQECGCRLFYRHGRGVALTPEGERFVERLRPAMRQLKAAADDLSPSPATVRGTVALGITPMLLELIGVDLVTCLDRAYPALELDLLSGYSGYVHEWLLDGRLDVAVLHDTRRSRHISVDPLAQAELFLISSPQVLTPAARRANSIGLDALVRLPLVLPTRNHGLRRTLEFAARSRGIELAVRHEVDNLALMKQLVARGFAHTILALPAVVSELSRGELLARRIVRPGLQTRLVLATALNRPLTQAGRAVLGAIRSVLSDTVQAARRPLYFELMSGTE